MPAIVCRERLTRTVGIFVVEAGERKRIRRADQLPLHHADIQITGKALVDGVRFIDQRLILTGELRSPLG